MIMYDRTVVNSYSCTVLVTCKYTPEILAKRKSREQGIVDKLRPLSDEYVFWHRVPWKKEY